MKNKLSFSTGLIASILLAAQAWALQPAAPTAYLSVDGGYSFTDYFANYPANTSPAPSFAPWSLVFGGNVGFLFTPHFGIEAGYLNVGATTISNIPTQGTQTTLLNNTNVYIVALKGILYDDENSMSLFMNAGVARRDISYGATNNYTVTNPSTITVYAPHFGIGLTQNMSKNWAVSAIAQASLGVGNIDNSTFTPGRAPPLYLGTLEITYFI